MNSPETFQQEFNAALRRYLQKPGRSDIQLTHRQTGEPLDYHQEFPDLFQNWLPVRSSWDRRSLIYRDVLDRILQNQIQSWCLAERYIDDRYPEKALQILAKNGIPTEETTDYWATYAKGLSVMGRYEQAITAAKQGLAIEPNHDRCQIQLADAYHLVGQCEAAYEIYTPIANRFISTQITEPNQDFSLSIETLIGFDSNVVHSPVYAVSLLSQTSGISEEGWDWAAGEFYWSPLFRCHHAYYLLNLGEIPKAWIKLLVLTQEMPWVKEAALNAMILFNQVDPNGEEGVRSDDRQWLANLIESNNWNADQMFQQTISWDQRDKVES
jgi:tetratricopeptide (TPR) repeat protein